MRDIHHVKKIAPTPADIKAMGDYKQGTENGKLAIYKMGAWGASWFLMRAKNEKPKMEFCVAPDRYDVGTKNALRGNDLGVNWYGISANAKNKAECMDVLYAFNDKAAGIFSNQVGITLPMPRPDVLSDPSTAKVPIIAAAATAVLGAAVLPPAANGRSGEINTLLGQRFGPVDTGEQVPDKAFLDKLAAEIQKILDMPKA